MVGLVDELGVEALETTLEPGDAFIGHTDGVTEARSTDGGFYGEDRFRELLRRLAGADAATIVGAIVADVAAFRAGAESSDDLTLLVVRHGPAGDPPAPSP
jgi:sigma-B regulation protein RsbU (phosphoserine phosphatase)